MKENNSLIKSICVIILMLITQNLIAQYDFNDNCKKAYNDIIKLKFASGEAILEQEKLENPQNLIPILLENYSDFLLLLISEEEDVFDTLKYRKSERLKLLEKGDKSSPYYKFSIAQIYMQWALIRIKFKEYLRGALEINKAYRLLEENQAEFPEFLPNKLSLGLLHVLIGSVPDNYKWVTDLFNIKGTVTEGTNEIIEYIDLCHEQDVNIFIPEGLFFYAFVQLNYSINPFEEEAFETQYDSLCKINPLIVFAYGRWLMKAGRNDEAIEVFTNRPIGKEYYTFYYLDYLTGICFLNKLDPKARWFLFTYISNFKGINYIKEANQKIAWSYLIQDNGNKYKEFMTKALYYGGDDTESDKLALREAKSQKIPNVWLLKARLLFDGGYYSKADSMLTESQDYLMNSADTVEYFYRSARVYHKWGKLDKAINSYINTIELGKDHKTYYAGNSALQLGNIFENQGEFPEAMKYYELCRDLDFDEYESSIHSKARAGLSRIKTGFRGLQVP